MAFPENMKQRAIELYKGCSATQALKALKKELPEEDMPDEKTIRRWHNNRLRQEQLGRIANLAAVLVSGFEEVYKKTPRGDKFDILEYSFWTEGYGYGVPREWLGSKFRAHVETVLEHYPEMDWKSFLLHIVKEFPEIERVGLALLAETHPYELLQILKRMVAKK